MQALSTTTIISCLIACLSYFEGVSLFVVASTSSTFLGGGGKSIVGGAKKPSKHESILQHLDQETSSSGATGDDADDDEVIYVQKRDGSRELLDGNKVRVILSSVVSKEELVPEGLSHFYSLTQMFLLVSDWSTARDADL